MTTGRAANACFAHEQCRHLRMGEIEVSIRSELPEVIEDCDVLYGAYRRQRVGERAICIEARAGRRSLWGRRQYVLCADGKQVVGPHGREEVFPYVEWGINGRVIATRADYIQVHAATLVRDGRALLLAGGSGAGKSTLAAGLMARGWTYFCDEFALIDVQHLRVHPFPKALCIKAGSFAVIERLKLPLWRRRHYSKHFKGPVGYVSPNRPQQAKTLTPCPVGCVIFPTYAPGQTPQLRPLSRAAGAFRLARGMLNRHAFGCRTMPLLCEIVRRAACFQLDAGPIEQTCDVVEALHAGQAQAASLSSSRPAGD